MTTNIKNMDFSKIESLFEDLVNDLVQIKTLQKGILKKEIERAYIKFFVKRDSEYYRNFENDKKRDFRCLYNFIKNNPDFDKPTTDTLKVTLRDIDCVIQNITYAYAIDLEDMYKSTFFKDITLTNKRKPISAINNKFADIRSRTIFGEIIDDLRSVIDKIIYLEDPERIESYYKKMNRIPEFVYDKEKNPSGITKDQFLEIAQLLADIEYTKRYNSDNLEKCLDKINKKFRQMDCKTFSNAVVVCQHGEIIIKNRCNDKQQ